MKKDTQNWLMLLVESRAFRRAVQAAVAALLGALVTVLADAGLLDVGQLPEQVPRALSELSSSSQRLTQFLGQ